MEQVERVSLHSVQFNTLALSIFDMLALLLLSTKHSSDLPFRRTGPTMAVLEQWCCPFTVTCQEYECGGLFNGVAGVWNADVGDERCYIVS